MSWDIAPGGADVYAFCYGRKYASALSMLTDVTGRAPLMPRAAYGVWWCQCCPAYSDRSFNEEVRSCASSSSSSSSPIGLPRLWQVLAEYRARALPLSIAVLDMDWHTDGWNHYTWEPTLFPDPAR